MYSVEVVRRARQKLADAKADKQSRYQQDLQTAYARQPRLKQIDMELRRSMAKAAQAAFRQGSDGRELLEKAARAGNGTPYYGAELERERKLLLGQAEENVTLPADDRELLLRAKQALAEDNAVRAGIYLDAAEDQTTQAWNYLRGESWFACGEHEKAADCYRAAEEAYPKETARRLEVCYRVLEDYKMAYFYACKQRE